MEGHRASTGRRGGCRPPSPRGAGGFGSCCASTLPCAAAWGALSRQLGVHRGRSGLVSGGVGGEKGRERAGHLVGRCEAAPEHVDGRPARRRPRGASLSAEVGQRRSRAIMLATRTLEAHVRARLLHTARERWGEDAYARGQLRRLPAEGMLGDSTSALNCRQVASSRVAASPSPRGPSRSRAATSW